MATTLYFVTTSPTSTNWSSGAAYTDLGGSGVSWRHRGLSTSRGAGVANVTASTVNGSTLGVEFGSPNVIWVSDPLAAAVTISGTVTLNLRAAESSSSANAAINCRVMRINGSTAALTQVLKTARTTELGTSEGAANFTATPTSTAFSAGDRIALIPFIDDAGTMASGFTATFYYAGTSAGNSGDSYVTFNEDITFASAPAGTTVYPTQTAASNSINPGAATEYEAWTSQPGSAKTAVTNTTNGATNAIQVTGTGGGTAVEWYTRPLNAFTLDGAVLASIRANESNSSANVGVRAEVAVTASDGTSATVWGISGDAGEIATSETTYDFWIAGASTSVTQGQRLRFRIYIDDAYGGTSTTQTMATGYTATITYAGAAGATGDTYFTLPASVAESSTSASAGNAAGTGAAYGATVKVSGKATIATGTGAGRAATAKVAPTATIATGTGAATNPSVTTSSNNTTDADADAATGTGAASDADTAVASAAGAAAATGSAASPSVTTASNAQATAASGAGAAQSPTPATASNATAGQATGTGDATDPTLTTASNATAGQAAGTGDAVDPTVTTSSATNATAGAGAAAGAAHDGTVVLLLPVGQAAGVGDAYAATIAADASVHPAAASGAGSSQGATVATTGAVTAGHAGRGTSRNRAARPELDAARMLEEDDEEVIVLLAAGLAADDWS